ncbi:uncharacterized protein LOC114460534 [Gouania willdenowi]|uniref:uncharacterized protein LOC114460534 n=1 Tax=Gouania willdenowi TaxID=441366 RepID=UPI00105639BD|nr:uncharacterized protein LOC114460534 [Gouania willdenowi]
MTVTFSSFTVSLWTFFFFFFFFFFFLLLLSPAASGGVQTLEPEVIGSPAPIFCSPGADVVLPCHLDPELDVRDLTVEWSRTDRSTWPQYVHIYRNRREVSTISRTRLFVEQLGHGNISLKVLNVSAEDGGAYRCFIPKLRSRTRNSTVRLVGHSFTVSLWTLLLLLLLLLSPAASGGVQTLEPEVIGSPAPIFCSPGADVVLPCHLDPELDVRDLTVAWLRTDRSARPQYVHIYKNRREVSTISRTRLFVEQLGRGNISLKVLNVSAEDGGTYRCFIPNLRSRTHNSTVQLVVDSNWFRKPTDVPWEEPGVTARSRVPVGVVSLLVVFAVVGLFVAFCVFKSRPENKGDGHAHNRPLRLTLQLIDERHQCGQFRDRPAGGAVL